MSNYRRCYIPGACYFFTAVTYERRPLFQDPANVDLLRQAMRQAKASRPFEVQAMVVLPDHLHSLWRLPEVDADFSIRWRDIKNRVSKAIDTSTNHRREKQVWQRRFWEHIIRDLNDWRRHVDYIHFNPVKHGYVCTAADWPHSSFARRVAEGWYPAEWGREEPAAIRGWSLE
jgi:putative transposase